MARRRFRKPNNDHSGQTLNVGWAYCATGDCAWDAAVVDEPVLKGYTPPQVANMMTLIHLAVRHPEAFTARRGIPADAWVAQNKAVVNYLRRYI